MRQPWHVLQGGKAFLHRGNTACEAWWLRVCLGCWVGLGRVVRGGHEASRAGKEGAVTARSCMYQGTSVPAVLER